MTKLLQRFLQDPVRIGSVADSSRWLAEKMVAQSNLAGHVLEIGAGTGPITRFILRRMPEPQLLTLVELDPKLAEALRRKFPQASTREEDAEAVLESASTSYSTVISGIPFAVMKPAKRANMFRLIKERLVPGGRFVMFQYSRSSEKELVALFGKENVRVHFVPLNFPPAFIFECHKK